MSTGLEIDVTIITSGHDVADARLHRQCAALRRADIQVEVLGLGDTKEGPEGCAVRTWSRGSRLRRPFLALTLPWKARGRVVMALDPDSTAGLWLRRLVGKFPGVAKIKTIADVHEDYRALLRDRSWAKREPVKSLGKVIARFGEHAATRMDWTFVADEFLAPGKPPTRSVLRNLPDFRMLPTPTQPTQDFRAVYVGDVRITRGIIEMLEVIADTEVWTLDVVGPLSADDERVVRRAIGLLNLQGRVFLHGRKPPVEAWKIAAGAKAGLLLLHDTPAFREAMPSKLYEYVAAGIPVLTTDLPRQAAFVKNHAVGEVVSDAAEAARLLEDWRNHPKQLGELAAHTAAVGRELQDQATDLDDFASVVAQLLEHEPVGEGT